MSCNTKKNRALPREEVLSTIIHTGGSDEGLHMREDEHTHSVSASAKTQERVYSQAQNTGAQLELHPDGLQHVSDELKLNTHKYTLKYNFP